jgi:hypothetical protein
MKRKKDVIKKAVLASVLAMSLNNVVWAAEGVDQPFSTVSELEALGGIASPAALAMLRRAFMPVVMILFIIAVLSSWILMVLPTLQAVATILLVFLAITARLT